MRAFNHDGLPAPSTRFAKKKPATGDAHGRLSSSLKQAYTMVARTEGGLRGVYSIGTCMVLPPWRE